MPAPRPTTLRLATASLALWTTACAPGSDEDPSVPKDQWGRSDIIRYFVPEYPDPFTPRGATLARGMA